MKAPVSPSLDANLNFFWSVPRLNEPRHLVRDCVLSTIGETPLVRLQRLVPDPGPQVLAKLEAFNPGGSIKDCPALHILKESLRSGCLDRNSVIIESSSGDMGIGLAQACRYHGLRRHSSPIHHTWDCCDDDCGSCIPSQAAQEF